jgi:putative ABC transport system substrate-binding protein
VWGARDPVAKQLEIYRQIMPGPQPLRLLTLIDPTDTATPPLLAEAREAAGKLGIELDERQAANDAGLEAAFQSLRAGAVDGAFILSPSLRLNFSKKILGLAAAAHLPVQAHRREWVDPQQIDQGALFSLGVDVGPVGAAAARFVDSILKGARPADLPAQEVPRVEFTLSLRRAKELGIDVPEDVVTQADRVYQ